MRSFPLRCAALAVAHALGLAWLAGNAPAQDVGAPALFPIPAPLAYPVTQTAARGSLWYEQAEYAPAGDPLPAPDAPIQQSVIAPDYESAMKGGWDSCTSCAGPACEPCGSCCGKYVYANALVMTHLKNGGFVTTVDSGTGSPELFFCSPDFGHTWHGGFEIGGGWCCGCNCNSAIEVNYWGLFSGFGDDVATGTLDSTIDFGDLDYGGGNGNDFYQGAAAHRIRFDQDFHSLEVNLIGNYGGPLGCGRCGCCNPCGCSKWGYGWLAGFRYINFSENWLFTTDNAETTFDNSDSELNYNVDIDNNLFGFQMGVGIDYCLTQKLQAYAISRFGIYGNCIDHTQRIYGSQGNATLNTGDFAGQDYLIDDSDFDLSLAGQFDIGGRYAINRNWAVDFGWRVLALSGVAITEDNVARNNFQNVLGISDTQTTGSYILHGGYAGLTYCW